MTLSIENLINAISGKAAAVRRVTRLEAIGEKVFPPTFEGGVYASEPRVVHDHELNAAEQGRNIQKIKELPTVLLDSVASQANRIEIALLRAYRENKISMPMVQVDFAGSGENAILREIGYLTALEAPHRIFDAIFRDSMQDGKPFREGPLGMELSTAKAANATALLGSCPIALIEGFWDSTGPRGGLGAKLQRALVSEIVGYQSVEGKRTASRLDPLQIENNVEIYARVGGGWTFDDKEAQRNKDNKPITRRPSEVNHGNIVPSLTHEDKNTRKQVFNHGGVTIAYAQQNTVLSLAALRRLRFPLHGGALSNECDLAGRVLLAALALAGICFLDDDGYDLRSRCLLDGQPGAFDIVGQGAIESYSLSSGEAAALLKEAARRATSLGLPWSEKPVTLQPSAKLARLVTESRTRSMSKQAEE